MLKLDRKTGTRISGENGITLLGLIVTIIVLLILSGISIGMLTDENGILTNAIQAKIKISLASVREIAELAYTNTIINSYRGQDEDAMVAIKKALEDEGYTVKEVNLSNTEITNVTLEDENGNEIGNSIKIPAGVTGKTLTVKVENASGAGDKEYYVLLSGLYYKIEIKADKVNIKDEGKKESELRTGTTNNTITLNLTGLTGLVKLNGNLVSGVTEIEDDDIITIDSQSETTTGTITLSTESLVNKTYNVAVTDIKIATDVKIEDKAETNEKSKIYNLTIDEKNKKNMMINTGSTNKVGLNATITSTGSGEDEDVLWKSLDTSILTVDSTGVMTGIKDGTTVVTATTEITGKTDEVEVTVTKFGEKVDYSVEVAGTTLDDWEILYEENGNTFIIYGDYLPNSVLGDGTEGTIKYNTKMTTGGELRAWWSPAPAMQTVSDDTLTLFKGTKYGLNSSYNNSKCASTLLNTENWDSLISTNLKTKSDENAKAIGSPTVEMWMESWNKVYPRDQVECRKNPDTSYGYQVKKANEDSWHYDISLSLKAGYKNTLYYPQTTQIQDPDSSNSDVGYWLASPAGIFGDRFMEVRCQSQITYNYCTNPHYSLRPTVCLPSNILGEKDNEGKWTLNLD